MDIESFFEPVNIESLGILNQGNNSSMLLNVVSFFSGTESVSLEGVKIVLLGIPESRNSFQNFNASFAPDEIRRQFYQLYKWSKEVSILDMGNLKVGKTVEDTYSIVAEIVAYFLSQKVIPILLGGSNDLAYAQYRGYEQNSQVVNIMAIDSCFDIGSEEIPISSNAYLNKIILQEPNYLLNYSNVGYQTYMNSPENIKLMDDLFFEVYRVGMMRKDLDEVEPIVRNAEMVTFDISAVRRPDAPGNPHGSANGFYGEEICQVARFAGLNDKLSSLGIFEFDPTLDYNNQTSQLISHFIWYFVEGFLYRQNDTEFKDQSIYLKHSVTVSDAVNELVFYCSKRTGRWWVIVPLYNKNNKIEQKYYLPCSRKDFEVACNDKIPERWWRTFHKLNR